MAMMRYLAIDPGGKRIGVAVGDDATGIASPLTVIPNSGGVAAVARRLDTLTREHDAAVIVVGLPTLSDGVEADGARRSHALAAALRALGWIVAFQEEYLTSAEARSRARESGRRTQQPIDDIAAAIILEEHLSRRHVST